MKKGFLFANIYVTVMISLIFSGIFVSKQDIDIDIDIPKPYQIEKVEQEVVVEEAKPIETNEESERWEPSKPFLIAAISIASVLDLLIILLWVKYDKKKRMLAEQGIVQKKSITDSKWFLWVVGLGILKKENDRLVVNWKLFISYFIILIAVKFFIAK